MTRGQPCGPARSQSLLPPRGGHRVLWSLAASSHLPEVLDAVLQLETRSRLCILFNLFSIQTYVSLKTRKNNTEPCVETTAQRIVW